jgi:hypothetical protein
MRGVNLLLAAILITTSNAQAQISLKVKNLGDGWTGLTRQADPFDKTKVQVIQIIKGKFTFRCREINLDVSTGSIDGFNLSADIKYIIDGQDPIDKSGWYSSYLGGSDTVTRSSYFSAFLSNDEVKALRSGKVLKFAGKFGSLGWTTKELKLNGFAKAYDAMCKNEDN